MGQDRNQEAGSAAVRRTGLAWGPWSQQPLNLVCPPQIPPPAQHFGSPSARATSSEQPSWIFHLHTEGLTLYTVQGPQRQLHAPVLSTHWSKDGQHC